MALIGLKQLDSPLTGSLQVSGSSGITGSITVTGNISGSATSTGSFGTIQTTTGTIPTLIGNTTFRDNLTITGNLDVSDTIYHTGDSNTKIRFPEADTIAFHTSGDERLRITSDGQISGSSISTGSFGNVHVDKKLGIGTQQPLYELEVRGDVGINQYIYHNDDSDTRINFTSDRIKIELGGTEFLDARNTSQDFVTIGGSSDIDAKLEGGDGYVFVQGSDGFVGIKDDTPTHQLDVAGTGRFTGQLNVNSDLVVDGKIVAQEFHTEFVSASIQYSSGSTQFGNTEDDTHTFSGSISLNSGTTKEFSISGSGLLSGSFATSASFGRIDTSGDIYSSGRIFEQNTSVIDHATAMAIVFGG